MTKEEAREKYGNPGDGYVSCSDCPLKPATEELCSKYRPGDCSGFVDTWEAIAEYFTKEVETTEKTSDMVNHPSHYNNGGMECIDEMVLIFGKVATMYFCLCNAWKYRYRANAKNGQEDLDKANWYIAKYKELKEGLTNAEGQESI